MPIRSKSGFTLAEVMSVAGIVMALCAIGFVAYGPAKAKAAEQTCISNLRQSSLALMLYQEQHDGGSQYGTTTEMGLPPQHIALSIPDIARSFTCRGPAVGVHLKPALYPYTYMAAHAASDKTKPRWADYSLEYRDASIILVDMAHNAPDVPLRSEYVTIRGLGVTIGGTLVRKQRIGVWYYKPWWNTYDEFRRNK